MPCYEVFDNRPIGGGAFSSVYAGKWELQDAAVKRLNYREDGNYFEEAQILSKLKHPNIVRYFGIIQNDDFTYDIFFELACGRTLAGVLHQKNMETSWKRSTIHQIASGVAYLHSKGILHLDLKPPNILFKNYDLQQPLIADFGMAKVANTARRAGARKFRAPDSPFTRESDVFSLASIACCIFYGKNPDSESETKGIVSRVLTDDSCDIHAIWLGVLRRGVSHRPFERPTAMQFRDAFEATKDSDSELPDETYDCFGASHLDWSEPHDLKTPIKNADFGVGTFQSAQKPHVSTPSRIQSPISPPKHEYYLYDTYQRLTVLGSRTPAKNADIGAATSQSAQKPHVPTPSRIQSPISPPKHGYYLYDTYQRPTVQGSRTPAKNADIDAATSQSAQKHGIPTPSRNQIPISPPKHGNYLYDTYQRPTVQGFRTPAKSADIGAATSQSAQKPGISTPSESQSRRAPAEHGYYRDETIPSRDRQSFFKRLRNFFHRCFSPKATQR